MMTRTPLPFQYKMGESETGLTSFAGLPLYIDMAAVTGLCETLSKTLTTKVQGWTDLQILISLIILQLAGGDCVDDIERLEADEGMRTLMLRFQTHGMKRSARRAYEKRWRQSTTRAFPSASVIRRYLEQFHDPAQEALREKGRAFIPTMNAAFQALVNANQCLIDCVQAKHPCETATLDQDATLTATNKRQARYCYKKFKAYQPFNTYWHEQGLLVHSEFRDGNVPAGLEQLRLLKESLERLPDGVKKVSLRSDSAGYQEDLLRYCARGENKRFGVIEFAIAAKISEGLRSASAELDDSQWHCVYHIDDQGNKIETGQQWAEVCFVPNWVAQESHPSAVYRYLAIRTPKQVQLSLKGMESDVEAEASDAKTVVIKEKAYKLYGLITNRTMEGNELINWYRKRCGEAEQLHSTEKSDLGGGQFPSNKFGANAAWWQIMILTFNLHGVMKQLALPSTLKKKRMKAIRFHVIGVAGRLISHARELSLKVSGGRAMYDQLREIREKIAAVAQSPPHGAVMG